MSSTEDPAGAETAGGNAPKPGSTSAAGGAMSRPSGPGHSRPPLAGQPNSSSGAVPGVFSTLFPHAGDDQVNEFRWALGGGILGLALLIIAGLITAAIILAALLVPVLYVMYLYEARVYRDAPIPVVGFTVGGGVLLGIIVTALANRAVPNFPVVVSTPFGVNVDVPGLLLVGLVVPLIREILKPAPALLLRGRADLSQTIDGLVLGIATGLGFSIAETLIRFSQILTSRGLDTAAAGWISSLLSVAIFTPLISGSTTGLITAALWRYRRGGALGAVHLGAIIVALAASVAHGMGTLLLVELGAPQIVTLGWELVVTLVVLAYVRLLLVRGLHEEAQALGLPDPTRHAQPEAR